jgi:hypothetical protein
MRQNCPNRRSSLSPAPVLAHHRAADAAGLSFRSFILAPIGYFEIAPPADIATHVACVWVSTGPASGRVLPDGCVDLVWRGDDLVVAGPSTRAFLSVPDEPDIPRVGVRFRIGAAGAVLGLPADELRDRSPALRDVWRRGAEVTDRVATAPSVREQLRILSEIVARRDRDPVDPVVRRSVLALTKPGTRIGQLGEAMSDRQLRRRFDAAVGYSPKTLFGVLRLQRFLALAGPGARLGELAYEAGYADQSHLGRDAMRLTGLSPKALLAGQFGAAGEAGLTRD